MIFSANDIFIFDHWFTLILELTPDNLGLKIQPKGKVMHETDKFNYNDGRKNKYQVQNDDDDDGGDDDCFFFSKWLTN